MQGSTIKDRRIGLIISALNEGPVIGKVLAGLPKVITHGKARYQLVPVVVNDGSSDDTSAVARKHAHVVVIDHLMNGGQGSATRTGLRYLRENGFEYGATMDADGQHHPDDVVAALHAVIENKADLVIGSRLLNMQGMPWLKVLGNRGLNIVTMLLLGVISTDSQSGLKAFNRQVIEKLQYRENGYAWCSEIIWRAHKAGLRISEVPIAAIYTEYSMAKGQSNWNAVQIIKQLAKHRLQDLTRG